jgi:hypothetical protein
LVFFTLVAAHEQVRNALLLMDCVRAFGGRLADRPFWVVVPEEGRSWVRVLADAGAETVPMAAPPVDYLFARKVAACAAAEERADGSVDTLCWLIPECLVLKPPVLFELPPDMDAAVRPVHIRNVGLPAGDDPDPFWRGVYETVGEPDPSFTVRSFIEDEVIRPYFNSAALSLRPTRGLFREWLDLFGRMVTDEDYQSRACGDRLHQIFLHQAILSTLVATRLERASIVELPPDYGYPYNLHGQVPEARRAAALDDTVCPIYEERPVDPGVVDDIEVREPLLSWLEARTRV